jgi:tRNA-modifying protein YgfZ
MTDLPPSVPTVLDALRSAVVCPVPDLGVLLFEGTDSAAFLQGQVSSDVAALAQGQSQRSSYNSPKGRMLANLRLWRDPDSASGNVYGMLLAADLADALAKRLAMFVLRAKVAIANATGAHALLGIAGQQAKQAVAGAFHAAPAADEVTTVADGTARLLGLPDGRYVLVAMAEAERTLRGGLGARAVPGDAELWRWLSIRAGVPLVTTATSDRFVPQMLNWDALGGVSFQKGCYPGQEIVARTRYLGRLKERLYGFHVAAVAQPAPGTRLYSPAFGTDPCGTVVSAARAPEGGTALLAVVQKAAAESGVVSLASPDGPTMIPVALPYTVDDDPLRGRASN